MNRFRFLAIFATLMCSAQELAPIRVDVRLVNVAFMARDSSGKLLNDLTKDDFEVWEDNVKQNIALFSQSRDLPLSLGLVMDMSGSQAHFHKKHEKDLKTFLKSVLTPRDRAFLLCFGNRLRVAADFSPEPREITEGLKNFDHKRPQRMPELGPDEIRRAGTAFYDAMYYSIKEKLGGAEHARKAMLVFSDGEDNSSAHHMLETIEAAQSENIPVFGIRYTETERGGRLTSRNKYGMGVMSRIGKETGGADFDAEKEDLKKTFKEIGEQLRSLYELGYYTTNPTNDKTFHKLVIKPKRPGLTIRTKTGYYAHE
ncbi:MAG TPA: VWA domain-containing protein [Bryobacteraceae bacterium]|nr:VWA domain-containing protein [Bryobacteraceae bacterium]